MNLSRRLTHVIAMCAMWAATASAQTTTTAQPSSQSSDASTRPATTTFNGDTGLWFVPTAEVLGSGKWSISGYRRGTDYDQGYTNVADFAGTFAIGIKGRAEIFGSFLADTRIDRDTMPVFFNNPTIGGFIDRYPLVNQTWTGDGLGDLYLGAKVNLMSESRQKPLALAVRGLLKVPTANTTSGNGTGAADAAVDFIASKEAGKMFELSGYVGAEYLGQPSGFTIPSSAFRWGAGAGFPSRSPVRVTAELVGYRESSNTASITSATLVGVDGSLPPVSVTAQNLTEANFGITFQAPKGFFVGVGLALSLPEQDRNALYNDNPNVRAEDWDWQVRIGYHPGAPVYVPPPPSPPPPPPPAPAPRPREHTLTVKADCNPCTVQVLMSSTVTATPMDSIGCAVTYRWTTPTGMLATPNARQSLWTASNQAGTVLVRVTVTCPTDNKTASDTASIQVTPPPARTYTFEDVHFDFDRYSLRPEATRVLDEAVNALREDGTLRVQIEGHTCNIGTAEYNLALGDRRATAVKDYLVSRGVAPDRLTTISYGEERPKYDNSREETRRLNRRAALVVNLRR
jgi:outer membrane protein OmpA-like peptidoglycan-associated protein